MPRTALEQFATALKLAQIDRQPTSQIPHANVVRYV